MKFNIPEYGTKICLSEGVDTRVTFTPRSSKDFKLLGERFCDINWADPDVEAWKTENPGVRWVPRHVYEPKPNGEESVKAGFHIPAGTLITIFQTNTSPWGGLEMKVGIRLQTPKSKGKRYWKIYKIWLKKETIDKLKYVPILSGKDFGWRILETSQYHSWSRVYANQNTARRAFNDAVAQLKNYKGYRQEVVLEKYNGQFWTKVEEHKNDG